MEEKKGKYLSHEVAAIQLMQDVIEESISNFEIIKHEDLYDEVNDAMLRSIYFNRGTKDYFVVLDMYGRIAAYQLDIPRDLLLQIYNSVIGLYVIEEAREY